MSGFDVFMQNPYWKEYYESAPTERLKKYIRYEFDFSASEGEDEKAADNADAIMYQLDETELNWLIDHEDNQMMRAKYRDILKSKNK